MMVFSLEKILMTSLSSFRLHLPWTHHSKNSSRSVSTRNSQRDQQPQTVLVVSSRPRKTRACTTDSNPKSPPAQTSARTKNSLFRTPSRNPRPDSSNKSVRRCPTFLEDHRQNPKHNNNMYKSLKLNKLIWSYWEYAGLLLPKELEGSCNLRNCLILMILIGMAELISSNSRMLSRNKKSILLHSKPPKSLPSLMWIRMVSWISKNWSKLWKGKFLRIARISLHVYGTEWKLMRITQHFQRSVHVWILKTTQISKQVEKWMIKFGTKSKKLS